MEYIINFPTFLLESLGIDKNIESQAKEIFKEINGSEKCEFNLIYFIETGNLKAPFTLYIKDLKDTDSSGEFNSYWQ